MSFNLWYRLSLVLPLMVTALVIGCNKPDSPAGHVESVWGRRGVSKGRMLKPRAMAINAKDQLFIVDMTARIQVFDRNGEFLYSWRTPEFANGKPSGLSFDLDGNLLVADTHYFRGLVYAPTGELLEDRTIGGTAGHEPGQFGFVTDMVQDSHRNYYIAEYGEFDRIQKFTEDGQFIMQWGGHGSEAGMFIRPQNMAVDDNDHIWVVDACNHRVQVFDATGKTAELVRIWGQPGSDPGQLRYPYDLVLDGEGHVYVSEFGNHRVQKLTLDGQSKGFWGTHGRAAGQCQRPWALARDSSGKIHVLDTYNHRVQRISL